MPVSLISTTLPVAVEPSALPVTRKKERGSLSAKAGGRSLTHPSLGSTYLTILPDSHWGWPCMMSVISLIVYLLVVGYELTYVSRRALAFLFLVSLAMTTLIWAALSACDFSAWSNSVPAMDDQAPVDVSSYRSSTAAENDSKHLTGANKAPEVVSTLLKSGKNKKKKERQKANKKMKQLNKNILTEAQDEEADNDSVEQDSALRCVWCGYEGHADCKPPQLSASQALSLSLTPTQKSQLRFSRCICGRTPERCACGSGYIEDSRPQFTSPLRHSDGDIGDVTGEAPLGGVAINNVASTLSPLATEFVPNESKLTDVPVFLPHLDRCRPFNVAITVGDPVLVMDAWDDKWRVSRVAAGLFDWARVAAHPGLFKKEKRRWAQSLPPEERARLRHDKLSNQRGLQDADVRRRSSSARRKSARRESRRLKIFLTPIFKTIQQPILVVEDPSLGNRGDRLMPIDCVLMEWEPLLSTVTRSSVRASNRHIPTLTHHIHTCIINIPYLKHTHWPLLSFPSPLDVELVASGFS